VSLLEYSTLRYYDCSLKSGEPQIAEDVYALTDSKHSGVLLTAVSTPLEYCNSTLSTLAVDLWREGE